MMPNRKDHEVGDVVTGPWTNTPAEPVEPVEGELVEREPVEAPTRRLESPGEAGTGATGPVAAVRPGRPLTVEQAGGRYQYVTSLAAAGARRIPSSLLDGVLNRVKLAHLREGGTHRGEILPAQRNVYEAEMRERRDRRRRFGVALFVRKTRTTSHSLSGKHVRDAHRPRWETVAPVGAEVANLTWPHTPILSPLVNGVNGVVAEATGAVVGAVGDGISAAAMSTPGAAAMALGAAGVVAWQARNEHHDRQSQLIALMSADGNADLMPDEEADYLTAAFRAAGIIKSSTANAAGQHVRLLGPILPEADCWTARVELPKGVTAGRARGKHAELAGALDSDTHRVLLLDGETDRQLVLRKYERLPFSGDGTEYPLATAATFDIFDGAPFGTDLFGRQVRVGLTSAHSFSGGRTRNGKTFSERVKVAAAVLDPYVDISLADFKPAGDWSAVRKVARHFIEASDDDFEDALLATRDMLKDAQGEISRRMGLLRGPAGQRHGAAGQINRSMARDLQLRCGPWLIVIDEIQRATGDPQAGDRKADSIYLEILNLIDDIARRGAAVGVLLSLATQKPDGNILKSSTWDQLGNRFCLHVSQSKISDVVLGDGAAAGGADASTLIDRKQRGAGYLAGAITHDDRYVLTKSHNVSAELFAELCERGRRARAELGTLPEAAADGPQQTGPTSGNEPAEGGDLVSLGGIEQQILTAAVAVYGSDDAEWISAAQLYTEVLEGELGWTVDKGLQMKMAATLAGMGVEKDVEQVTLPSGKKTRITRYRREHIVAAGARLDQAA